MSSQQIESIVQQLLKKHKQLIQNKTIQQQNNIIIDALLPIFGKHNLVLVSKLVEERTHNYNDFKKKVVVSVQQEIKREQQLQKCKQITQVFKKKRIYDTKKDCKQMLDILCKTTKKQKNCVPNLKEFQQAIQQQHMVPFLFQQDIDKKFRRLDLFYYDEIWGSTVTKPKSFFQQEFPGLKSIDKNSASPTVVYKGLYKGRKIFVKSFECGPTEQQFQHLDNNMKRISYEKEVYRYIRAIAEKDNEVRRHFINMLFCAKDKDLGRAYIFSQDSGGMSVYDFMDTERTKLSCQFFKNIMVQFLYLIYLMHDRLHVVHNDLHFGNVLIVKDNEPHKTYTFYGKTFNLENHPYYLIIYDFDQASIYDPPSYRNPYLADYLCKKAGRCCDYPDTDLYTYLYFLLNNDFSKYFTNTIQDQFQHIFTDLSLMVSMPFSLYKHVKKSNYTRISCDNSVASNNNMCVHPKFDVSLHSTTLLLWNAFNTDIDDLLAKYPSQVLYYMEPYNEYVGVLFFLIKNSHHDSYKLTTHPSTQDIKDLISMNSLIENDEISKLILPSYEKYTGVLYDFFKKQYNHTKSYHQIRPFQQYLKKIPKNIK